MSETGCSDDHSSRSQPLTFGCMTATRDAMVSKASATLYGLAIAVAVLPEACAPAFPVDEACDHPFAFSPTPPGTEWPAVCVPSTECALG
jgi:hypothetical protein